MSTTNSRPNKFLHLRVNAKVVDPDKLIRHARALWEESGRRLAAGPRTVEEALVVAMVTLPDGTPPAEYGVALAAQCKTKPSVFERVNAETIEPILEEESRRFAVSEEARDITVEVGADYFHRGRVVVRASSQDEAERLALKRLGDIELKPVERVEGTSFARALA